MNWTPNNIFQHKDEILVDGAGHPVALDLYRDGWMVIVGGSPHGQPKQLCEGADVWQACACLNQIECQVLRGTR